MGRTRHQIDLELQDLYDEIPPMADCKGHCWMSCGPIYASDRERQRLAQAGFRLPSYTEALRQGEDYWCPALGPDGRCQAYESRPLICRAWGAVEGLKCPWDCVPEDGYLPDEVMRDLISESLAIGGGTEAFALEVAEMRATLATYTAHSGDKARAERYGTQLPEAITRRKSRKARPGTPAGT